MFYMNFQVLQYFIYSELRMHVYRCCRISRVTFVSSKFSERDGALRSLFRVGFYNCFCVIPVFM